MEEAMTFPAPTPQDHGKVNQKYYLDRQRAGLRHRWNNYTKKPEFYSEFVSLTPAMAKELLENPAPGSRATSQMMVDRFVADIANGRWQPNHPISINSNGELADGRHRVEAIQKAGKEVTATIEFNVDYDAVPPPKKKNELRSIDDPWDV